MLRTSWPGALLDDPPGGGEGGDLASGGQKGWRTPWNISPSEFRKRGCRPAPPWLLAEASSPQGGEGGPRLNERLHEGIQKNCWPTLSSTSCEIPASGFWTGKRLLAGIRPALASELNPRPRGYGAPSTLRRARVMVDDARLLQQPLCVEAAGPLCPRCVARAG